MTVFWSLKRLPNVIACPFSSRTSSLETAAIFSLVGMSLGDTLMSDVSSSSLVGPELSRLHSHDDVSHDRLSSAGSGPSGPPRPSPINPRADVLFHPVSPCRTIFNQSFSDNVRCGPSPSLLAFGAPRTCDLGHTTPATVPGLVVSGQATAFISPLETPANEDGGAGQS